MHKTGRMVTLTYTLTSLTLSVIKIFFYLALGVAAIWSNYNYNASRSSPLDFGAPCRRTRRSWIPNRSKADPAREHSDGLFRSYITRVLVQHTDKPIRPRRPRRTSHSQRGGLTWVVTWQSPTGRPFYTGVTNGPIKWHVKVTFNLYSLRCVQCYYGYSLPFNTTS